MAQNLISFVLQIQSKTFLKFYKDDRPLYYCPYAQKAISREIGHWYRHGTKPPTLVLQITFLNFCRIDHYNKHRWIFCLSNYWKAMWSCCCCLSSQIPLYLFGSTKKSLERRLSFDRSVFDCMLSSCHIQVSVWIYTL